MGYPVPSQKELFFFTTEITDKFQDIIIKDNDFSWKKKNEFIDEYIEYINKYSRLYRALPFVKAIYICNSITFNSLRKDSDIDLFIITKANRLWLDRFFSAVLFFLF
jgi:hypothetical protein